MCWCGDVYGCLVCLTWHVSVCVVVCVGAAINLGQQLYAYRKNRKERKGQSQGGRKVEIGDLPLFRSEQTLNCCPFLSFWKVLRTWFGDED